MVQRLKQKIDNIFEHAEPNLPLIGLFGTVGYPLFYIVWKYIFPQQYENLTLRLIEAVIASPWLLYRILPKKIKVYIPVYFMVIAPILMPFFFHFMMLKNEWSVVWVMSSMACLVLLILIINDWRFVCGYTLLGYAAAYAVVYFTDGYVSYAHFSGEYIPIYLFLLVGGLIANHQRLAAQQTKLSLMRSLSGSIAHEMRNPLNSITNAIGMVQTIIPDKPERNDEHQKYLLSASSLRRIHEVIEEGLSTVKRGNKIIDSILATLQDGAMEINTFKKVSSNNVIHFAVANYGYNDMQEMAFVIDDSTVTFDFLGDKDLFIYVLFNLINNALHYKSKPGFKIEITTEAGDTENYIRVRDTGPGVPMAKRELIFERFYSWGKSAGNGLGLAFCRRVIESFGGEITCDSEEGHWTEFTIKLPAYNSKIGNDLKRQIIKNKRILIVDDHSSNRLLLMKFVLDWNCIVEQAENGKQALDMLSKVSYDLVFMDFEMPVLTGDSAVSMLRQMQGIDPTLAQHYEDMPVIGITALTPEKALPRAAACGMNEVLYKPLKKADINNALERYFFTERPSISSLHGEALSKSRILLVDDNDTSRKFMSMILEHYGCSIGQANNGKRALEMLDMQDYDLIVMDLQMPDMNGVDAAKAIRKGECFTRFKNYSRIPILALTGHTDPHSISEIENAGMSHFLSKPIIKDELVSTIAFWLKNGHLMLKASANIEECEKQPSYEIWTAISQEEILDHSIISTLKSFINEDEFASLLDVFFRDADYFVEELCSAAADGDIKRFENLAHTLKGSSGSIGANRLFVIAKHFNELAHRGEWPDHHDWNMILKNTYGQTVEEMKSSMKTKNRRK